MVRTQVQIPDALYAQVKALAAVREVSLAELVRNGLEYIVRVSAKPTPKSKEWKLPEPINCKVNDSFFDNPNWRYDLHMAHVEAPYIKAAAKRAAAKKKAA